MSSFDATYLAARITETQPLGRAVSMPPLAASSPRAELTRLTRLVESLVAETNALRSENARATRELRQAKSVLVDLAKYLKEAGVLTNLDLLQKVDSLGDDRSSSASGSPSEEGLGPLAPLIEEASRQDSLPSTPTAAEDISPSKQRPSPSKGAAAGDLLTPRNAVKRIRDAALEDMHHHSTSAAAGAATNATHASSTERACLPRAHSLHALGSCKGDLTPRSMAKLVSLYPPPPPNHLEPTRSGGQHEITRCASLGHLDWSFEGSALDPLVGPHDVASPLPSSSPAATMPRSPWSGPILATSTVNTPHALPDLSLSGSPHKPPPPPPSSSHTPLSPPQSKTHTHTGVCRGKWLMSHMHRYTSTGSSAHAPPPPHTPTPPPPPAPAAAAHTHTHAHAHAHIQHTTHTRTPPLPQPPAAAYPVARPASQPPPPQPPPPTHTQTHTPVSAHTPSTTHTPATHTHTNKKRHDTSAPAAPTEEGSKDQPTPSQPAAAQADPCVRKSKPVVTNPLQSFTRRFSMIKPPPTTATVEQEKEYLPRPFGLRRISTCPPAIPSGLGVHVDGDGGGEGGGGGGDGV